MDPCVAMTVEQLWQPVPGGSGRYIVELARRLGPQAIRIEGVSARHGSRAPTAHDLGLNIPVARSLLPRRMLYAAWDHLDSPRVDGLVPNADLLHATTWAIPPTHIPLVVTVHDTAFLRDASHFTPHGVAYFKHALERTRERARLVVVPSQTTADDCIEAKIPAERIRVIPHGVTHVSVDSAKIAHFKERNHVTRPYALWVGTREPRKNLSTLLRAYRILLDNGEDLDLVLVGPTGWGSDSQEHHLIASLPKEHLHILGRVSEENLICAYAGARVFCFPSIWEGFGLPVLEAMDQGVPVVTSRGTSMAEVTGSAGLLVDPTSAAEVAEALRAAAGPNHKALSTEGRLQAAKFTWEASAKSHAEVYREVLE